ncbi:MAG: hypothetical protein Q8O92_06625 [Candidatus Latescibacter sp.]|nr:hypothetical protein [Candidatus Latescibacter sp.]
MRVDMCAGFKILKKRKQIRYVYMGDIDISVGKRNNNAEEGKKGESLLLFHTFIRPKI